MKQIIYHDMDNGEDNIGILLDNGDCLCLEYGTIFEKDDMGIMWYVDAVFADWVPWDEVKKKLNPIMYGFVTCTWKSGRKSTYRCTVNRKTNKVSLLSTPSSFVKDDEIVEEFVQNEEDKDEVPVLDLDRLCQTLSKYELFDKLLEAKKHSYFWISKKWNTLGEGIVYCIKCSDSSFIDEDKKS